MAATDTDRGRPAATDRGRPADAYDRRPADSYDGRPADTDHSTDRGRRGELAAARRAGRLRPLTVAASLTLALAVTLAACCPASSPPPTAFTAHLRALGGGEALARLADGRELTLTGVESVPAGQVYVTGNLLADGRVAVTSVRPLDARAGGG